MAEIDPSWLGQQQHLYQTQQMHLRVIAVDNDPTPYFTEMSPADFFMSLQAQTRVRIEDITACMQSGSGLFDWYNIRGRLSEKRIRLENQLEWYKEITTQALQGKTAHVVRALQGIAQAGYGAIVENDYDVYVAERRTLLEHGQNALHLLRRYVGEGYISQAEIDKMQSELDIRRKWIKEK